MPSFSLVFILDAIFIIHAAKTGRFWPWAYVMLFLPGIGVGAYVLMEVLPEYRYAPGVRKTRSSLGRKVNPKKRYRALRAELDDADTIGNRLALAQECLALRKYDEALPLFDQILASPQGDEPLYYLGKAQAAFGLGQAETTLATLDDLKQRWPQSQSQEGRLLKARALEAVGRTDEALWAYEHLSRSFAGQEVQVRRLLLLDKVGQRSEAEAIATEVMRYRKRAPSYARRHQAEWFAAAKTYLQSRSRG